MLFVNLLILFKCFYHTLCDKDNNDGRITKGNLTKSIINKNHELVDIASHCNISVPSLGMGYDSVIGEAFTNTFEKNTLESSSDIGYKAPIISIPVTKWNYNKKTLREFNINSYLNNKCKINGMWIRKSTVCEQRALPSFMKTTESLYNRHYSGDLIDKNVIQLALKNNKLRKSIKGNINTNVDGLVCFIYEAAVILPTELNFTDEFNNAIKNLPTNFNKREIYNQCPVKLFTDDSTNSICLKVVKPWIDFFKKFGTHIITYILVGGQMINTESYSNITDKIVGKNFKNNDSKSKKSNYKNLISRKKSTSDQWSMGGIPRGKLFLGNAGNSKDEYYKWARSLRESPMPIECGLSEIFTISSEKQIKKLIKPYKSAFEYYYELYGPPRKGGDMSRGVFNSLDKVLSEMDVIIQKGKYPFSHCKDNEEVVIGFSLRLDDGKIIKLEECQPARDGCVGEGEGETSFTFILCSKEPNRLITSVIDSGKRVNCPENYIIALGFTESSIGSGEEFVLFKCKGEKSCQDDKSTWLMCVHENVPGIMTFKGEKFVELNKTLKTLIESLNYN